MSPTQSPQPPIRPCPFWDMGVFITENPSKSAPCPEPGGLGSQIQGSPLAPLLLQLLKPHQGDQDRGQDPVSASPSPGFKKGTEQKDRSWSLGTLIPAEETHLAEAWCRKSEIPKSQCGGLSSLGRLLGSPL